MKKTFLLLCVALTLGTAMMVSCKKDNAAAEPTIVLTEGTFVDMGGSVLWCSRNWGANTPFEAGNFVQWGSVTSGDAADIDPKCSGTWRLPTRNEVKQLLANQKRVALNGTKGYLLTGTNGNTLFIPCAGKIMNKEKAGEGISAYFWTSENLDANHVYNVQGNWDEEKDLDIYNTAGGAINLCPLRVVMNKE